jgi:hypothetical protein
MSAQDQDRVVPLPPERSLAVIGKSEDARAGMAARSPLARPASDAAFLVQMMACRDDVAAYRRVRRAAPDVVQAHYRAALALIGDAA